MYNQAANINSHHCNLWSLKRYDTILALWDFNILLFSSLFCWPLRPEIKQYQVVIAPSRTSMIHTWLKSPTLPWPSTESNKGYIQSWTRSSRVNHKLLMGPTTVSSFMSSLDMSPTLTRPLCMRIHRRASRNSFPLYLLINA